MSLTPCRELRALDMFDVLPAGHFGLYVMGQEWAPHLRPGEFAVVDPGDPDPQPGELYALGFAGVGGERLRIVQVTRHDGPGVTFRHAPGYADGPLTPVGWNARCYGRVVGVMTGW